MIAPPNPRLTRSYVRTQVRRATPHGRGGIPRDGWLVQTLTERRRARVVSDATHERRRARAYGCWFVSTIAPLAANIPPTPSAIETWAPGTWAGAMPRSWRTLSCSAYIPYIPECM